MCDSVTVSFNVVLHPANMPLFCRREHIGPRANLCKWVCVRLLQWSQSSCVSVMSYNVQARLRLANRHHRESNSICWVWICSLSVYYIPCSFLDIILMRLIHRAIKWDSAGWRLNVTLATDRMCDSERLHVSATKGQTMQTVPLRENKHRLLLGSWWIRVCKQRSSAFV